MILIIDNRIVLAMIKTTELQSNPWIINPREVPAAGGCSVLVITIMIIPIPTEIAADILSISLESPILNIWTTPTIIGAIIMATSNEKNKITRESKDIVSNVQCLANMISSFWHL